MGTPITFKLDISATYTHGNNTFSISGTDRSNYSSNIKPNFNGFIQQLYYEVGDNIEISFNSNDQDISFIIFDPNLDISFSFDKNNPNYTISFEGYDNYRFGYSSLNAYGEFNSYISKADTRTNLFEYIASKYNAIYQRDRLQAFNRTDRRFIGNYNYIKSDATRIGVDSYDVNNDLIIQSVANDIHIVTGEKQRTSIWGNLDVRGNVNCTGNIPSHIIDGTNYDDDKLSVNNKHIRQYISQLVDGSFNIIEYDIFNQDSSLSTLKTLANVMVNSYNNITNLNLLNNLDLSIQSIEIKLPDEDGLSNSDLSIVVIDNSLVNLIKINEENKIKYDVSVVNNGEYYINNVRKPILTLELGNTYQFKQDDITNATHSLNFYTISGTTYNDFSKNVTTFGTQGSNDYYIEIKVTNEIPKILYYDCSYHLNNNMGGKINIINSPTDNIELSGNFNNNTLEVNANSQIYGIFNYKATTNLNITSLIISHLIENSKIIIILDSSIYDISMDITQINNTDYYCNNNNITNANSGDILFLNIKKIKNKKTLNIIKYNKPLSRFISSQVLFTYVSSDFSYIPIFSIANRSSNINTLLKPAWLSWNGSALSGTPTNNEIGTEKVIFEVKIDNGRIYFEESLTITVLSAINFTTKLRNAVNYRGTLYGPDDQNKINITNNINGGYDIINDNSYGFIKPSIGVYDIYGNSVAGDKRFYRTNGFYIKFQLGRVNKEFLVGVAPNDNYPHGSDWGFLDYASRWLNYTYAGAMFIRFNHGNDYTINDWVYESEEVNPYHYDYRYGNSNMVSYESVNNGRNTNNYNFAINNQQIDDIVIIKYDGTNLNAALYDSNNILKQTILNNITDYIIPDGGVIFDTMLIRDAYIKNLYLLDSEPI